MKTELIEEARGMRRKDREITDFSKIIDIMKSCDCCRLGFVDNNEAYIVPMNFGYDITGEQIVLYFHCAKEGRKIDLIPIQSVVTFEMDTKHKLVEGKLACEFAYLYQCIMGMGALDIVSNEDEKIYGLKKIMAHYSAEERWMFNEKIVDMINVLKLSIKTMSCKEH